MYHFNLFPLPISVILKPLIVTVGTVLCKMVVNGYVWNFSRKNKTILVLSFPLEATTNGHLKKAFIILPKEHVKSTPLIAQLKESTNPHLSHLKNGALAVKITSIMVENTRHGRLF